MSASPPLVLASHALCPYVQRAAIVLSEKGVPFARREVDLGAKPAWFLAVSPLGKTPVLLVDGAAIFESAVICEYLDETLSPRMHPDDALERARHRGWIEVASGTLDAIAGFYNAPDEATLATRRVALRRAFERVESALGDGPYFAGASFSLVDAAFAPVFRYLDAFEAAGESDAAAGLARVAAWRAALASRPSVIGAARADYPALLRDFLKRRGSALSRRFAD